MNITIVCEVLGEANNGTTIAALNLIDYLKKQGHKVKVVCPDKDKCGKEGYYILPVINLGCTINRIIEKNNVVVARFDKEIFRRAIEDADVVHFMMPLFIARKASKYAKKMGKVVTAGFHAQAENFSAHVGLMNSRFFNHLVYLWYDHNLFCRCDAIHYPTKFIQDLFENEIKRKTNGYVISNGVNKDFAPAEVEKPDKYKDKYCILFTGRISKEKSHKVLIKAVSRSKYRDKIQLFFAGKGPRERQVMKLAKKLLPDNPPIIDFYSHKELVRLINFCDLYCHPAKVEIEAIACLEAISAGLVPVIANSPMCATKAFAIDERSLFKVDDHNDLTSKIDYFIEHPEEKADLRKKYLENSIKFDHDYCMELMEKMLIEEAKKGKKS